MCLTIRISKRQTPRGETLIAKHLKVAKKDITAYKVVVRPWNSDFDSRILRPLFQYGGGFEWLPFVMATSVLKVSHKKLFFGAQVIVNDGLHADLTKEAAQWRTSTNRADEFIVEVVIPKGAHYYTNGREIASNQMMIVGEVKKKRY
jgi:hypothetical protein